MKYMATSKTGTYSKIASVKSGTTSYAKSGLSTAKTYYFKVRAYTTLDGSKIYGSFGTIKYGTTATAAPAISSAAGGSGKATIKWGAVTKTEQVVMQYTWLQRAQTERIQNSQL